MSGRTSWRMTRRQDHDPAHRCARLLLGVVALGLVGCEDTSSPPPPPSPAFAYVSNDGDATVSVINTVDHAVVATIPVGDGPRGVAITPDGEFVYVATIRDDAVWVIETATNTVVKAIRIIHQPNDIAITPDGALAFVTNVNAHTLTVVNTATNEVAAFIDRGFLTPWGVAISTADYSLVATIPVGSGPRGLAITPNGAFAYVANSGDDTISVIETATNRVVATVSVSKFPGVPEPPVVESPEAVTFTPDGAFAYVTNGLALMSVFETTGHSLIARAPGSGAETAITPNGAFAYVADTANDRVVVVNTASNTGRGEIPVGNLPNGVAIAPR